MTPRKLVLRRVCQHYEKEIILTDGLNSLVGANGSGKSNIIHSLCLCLGLDTNLKGKKTDMIQDGYDKAEALLEFIHREIPGTIKVTLKRNYQRNWDEQSLLIEQAKAEVRRQQENPAHQVDESTVKLAVFKPQESTGFVMEWNGVKCRNGTELGEWFRTEVGVDPKMIVATYFPSQGDIDGALSADKAERQSVFASKAGTAACELIWSMLGKELTALEDFTGLDERHAQAKAAVAIGTAKVKELQDQFQAVEAEDRDAQKWHDVIQRFMRANEDRQKMGSLQAEAAKLTALIQAGEKDLAVIMETGKALRAKSDANKAVREETVGFLASAEAVIARESQRTKLIGELSTAKQQLEQTIATAPQEPPQDTDVAEMAAQIATFEQEAHRLEHYVQVFHTGKCPTCGSVIANAAQIPELAEKARTARAAAQDLKTKSVSLTSMKRQLESAKSAWQSRVASLQAKIAQVQSVLAGMPESTAPPTPTDLEVARQRLEEFTRIDGELQKARETYEATSRLLDRTKANLEATQRTIDGLAVSLAGAPTEATEAMAALSRAQDAQRRHSDLQIQLGIANGRLADAQTQLKDAAEAMQRVGPQKVWREMLETARDHFHRDALPSEVVAWYASSLVNHTMTYLKLFEVNFSVIVTPELDLLAIFPDKAMPVAKLSGGEKNMLNISMRLAMADLFPSDLRVLVLDEVEVHLDQTNVAKLPMLLEKVKSLARNRGLVVLFVSHHPSLRDIADNVIYSKEVA